MLWHDSALACAFLRSIYPAGPWVITCIEVDQLGIKTETFTPGDDAKFDKWLKGYNNRNIYYSVNLPTALHTGSKTEKTDIASAPFLHLDLDPRANEDFEIRAGEDQATARARVLDEERARILALLQSPPHGIPRPSKVVYSGGGYNALWQLEEPFEVGGDIGRALELERYNLKIEIALGGDSCHNVDRILRLPGTVNYPNQKKRKKGRVTGRAAVVWDEPTRYPLSAFSQASPIQIPGHGAGIIQSSSRQVAPGNVRRLSSVDELDQFGVAQKTKMLIVQGSDPDDPAKAMDRSQTLFFVCCEMARAKVPVDVQWSVLTDPDFRISASCLDKGSSVERYVMRQINRAAEWAINPHLEIMNRRHAVIANIGGACRVMEQVIDPIFNRPQFTIQSFTDFRNRYMAQKIKTGTDEEGNDIKEPVGKWWLECGDRRQHDSIVFAPGVADVGNSYNLWQGFKYEPRPGTGHQRYLDHVRINICGDNAEYYNYLMGWMATCVQRPNSPGHSAVVLRGIRGAGKSVFVKQFGELFGPHYMMVSNAQHLVGNFNAHLASCVVLFADEAFYAGDKKHESVLKTMVTEETIRIERKGVDSEDAPNYVHLLMAANDQWVVPAGPDERRYFVLDVGGRHVQDHSYFEAVEKDLKANKGAGYSNLLHFFQTYPLATFNVRSVPNTRALRDQKLLSMSSEVEWWHGKLEDGSLMRGHVAWNEPILKSALTDDYLIYAQRLASRNRSTASALGRFFARACGDGLQRRTYRHRFEHEGIQRAELAAFYIFPPLDRCRAIFDRLYGGPFDWPEIDDKSEPAHAQEAF